MHRLSWMLAALLCWCSPAQFASGQSQSEVEASGHDTERRLADALEVVPGATCLTPERIATQVRTWLGRDRVPAGLRVLVTGDDQDAQAVVFRIVYRQGVRERRFQGLPLDCEQAVAVVGLGISLALDAGGLIEREAGPARDGRAQSHLVMQLASGREVVPGTSVGAAAGLEHNLSSWLSARADVLTQVSWQNTVTGTAGRFNALLLAGRPQLCAGGTPGAQVRLELCAGAAFGMLYAYGLGYRTSHSAHAYWSARSAGLRLRFVAGIPWVIDLDALFPLRVPAIRAQAPGGRDVYREPHWAGMLFSLGPALGF